ncbi:protein of unknown function [Pararobbsia alpina]|uniref:hypothetical protein n=1 Tax=Pararobbsia alpina TaxID=621374 RepID=UPI0039A5A9FF
MKTLMAFDYSLPTDPKPKVLVIDEEGNPITGCSFVEETYPNRQFVMSVPGVVKLVGDSDVVAAAMQTRVDVAADYDRVVGAGEWQVIWLDAPRESEMFKAAQQKRSSRIVANLPSITVLEITIGGEAAPKSPVH